MSGVPAVGQSVMTRGRRERIREIQEVGQTGFGWLRSGEESGRGHQATPRVLTRVTGCVLVLSHGLQRGTLRSHSKCTRNSECPSRIVGTATREEPLLCSYRMSSAPPPAQQPALEDTSIYCSFVVSAPGTVTASGNY